ncbi:hypothetical protein BW723_08175 [Polaribacter reichenbachii]|uniref:DUF3703 domain-containing protein n=1 Tax=Polaribacter reichenbachii TaxID=996801 RepID=A0A1B8U6U6_9FLAO|nr:DUF3703 domain-containing protein [Polaribacter reichenbachii]APZ46273.1 hypothetical protein BW723_08175 [Polaribacter reichenbachii]AUC20136.1 hypothetical protein BTO17_16195 [Polaribacter reichenbachii]OBY67605.1 hypothetical protein LPB301_01315 [Polaribacter reichenbachii]
MHQNNLKKAFYHQLKLGKIALKQHHFKVSFYHLENAHILGQQHLKRHTLSHYWMLVYGLKTKNAKEIIGQITRIIASLLFTKIWVPKGNTGGSNVSPLKTMSIRKELKKYF